jgi:hypothetical protein
VSRLVESYSGITIPANKPIVGENVFTQVAGVHADGDNKNNLYCNELLPERFGRKREYALGKTSGKANIRKNLEALGLELDDEAMRKVTARIIELGDKKEVVTQEDLPYIISDVLKHSVEDARVKLLSYYVTLSQGLKPMASLKLSIGDQVYEKNASGDGQYDAFVRALRKIYKETLGRKFPMLTNYAVYPYDKDMTISDKGLITIDFPSEQQYAENSYGLGNNMMVAVTHNVYDTFLKFKNVGGCFKFQLYGDYVTVKSITLKGNNGEKIAGKATLTAAYDAIPSISMADDATTSITLDCGEKGVNIGSSVAQATAFWLVVPPTVFDKGITKQ